MFEYDEEACSAARKLDKCDFTHILNRCYHTGRRSPYDIMDEIDDIYPELGYSISCLSTDEFMEYLRAKYNARFEEVISYRLWGWGK